MSCNVYVEQDPTHTSLSRPACTKHGLILGGYTTHAIADIVALEHLAQGGFARGDRVKLGKGKTLWEIVEFGTWPNGGKYAALRAVEGYANTTATIGRLVAAS